jgi:predicted nucleotidyltransferase
MTQALERVADHLRSEQIPFAVIGATAMAIHGVSRATQDVDLLVSSTRCLRAEFWEALRASGLSIEVREGDDDDPLAGVVRVSEPNRDMVIDVIVGKPTWQATVLSSAQPQDIDGIELPVAAAADVILLKLYAGGVQDRWDIVQLLAANPSAAADVDARLHMLPPYALQLWRSLRANPT